jgi:hypothetical protein
MQSIHNEAVGCFLSIPDISDEVGRNKVFVDAIQIIYNQISQVFERAIQKSHLHLLPVDVMLEILSECNFYSLKQFCCCCKDLTDLVDKFHILKYRNIYRVDPIHAPAFGKNIKGPQTLYVVEDLALVSQEIYDQWFVDKMKAAEELEKEYMGTLAQTKSHFGYRDDEYESEYRLVKSTDWSCSLRLGERALPVYVRMGNSITYAQFCSPSVINVTVENSQIKQFEDYAARYQWKLQWSCMDTRRMKVAHDTRGIEKIIRECPWAASKYWLDLSYSRKWGKLVKDKYFHDTQQG